jgi:CRP/FNR family transcriptional regulator, cyclic AMP receptor protein
MTVLNHIDKKRGYQSFPVGAVIIKKGEPGDVMYIVKAGTVEVRDGKRILDTVEAGGVVGEVALIDAGERSASVVAKTDCQLLPIDEEQFVLLVERMPYFALQVMRVLAERLRRTTAQSRTVQLRKLPEKVRKVSTSKASASKVVQKKKPGK